MRFFRLLSRRCPGPQEWDSFLSGRLVEEADRALQRHVESCSSCQQRLRSTYPEKLNLRSADTGADYAAEPACVRLRQLAMTMALPDEDTTPVPASRVVAPPASHPLPPGYEYLGKIAEGGMGVVLKARQTRLGRVVAVKTVRPERGSIDDLTRFRDEAVKLARLQHPNIVPLYEAGDLDGRPYFTMEYVNGGNLLAWARSRRPAARRVAVLVRDVALAVAYAHAMGVVHRDLKPGNILMTREEVPKVTDFGLAKLLDGDQLHTLPGMLIGTAPYMAPEQIRNPAARVGPAVDVYGLGAILYELLAGKPPHHGSTRSETLRLVSRGEPAPPSKLRTGIPRDLEAICLTCLRADPADRYPSAAAVVEDLQRFINGDPIRVRKPNAAARASRWFRRNRTLAAVGLVATLGSLGGWQIHSQFPDDPPARTPTPREVAAEAATEAVSQVAQVIHLDARVRTDLDDGIRACERDQLVKGLLLMARAVDALPDDRVDLKPFARASLAAWAARTCKLLDVTGPGEGVTALALSGDGGITLSGDRTGRITVRSASPGETPRVLIGHNREITSLALSRNGKWLISGSLDGTARVWNLQYGEPVRTLTLGRDVRAVALTPDGSTALVGTAGSKDTLTAWNVRTGNRVNDTPEFDGAVTDLAVGEVGAFFVVTGEGRTARVWGDGDRQFKLEVTSGILTGAAVHPNGELIATGGDALRFWDARTGRERAEWRTAFGPVRVKRLTMVADGRVLLAHLSSNELRAWDTTLMRPFPLSLSPLAGVRAVAGPSNGREFLIGSTDGMVRRWELPPGQLNELVKFNPGWVVSQLQVSPGGGYGVAIANPGINTPESNWCDYEAYLLDLRTGLRVLGPYLHPGSRQACIAAIDPTGRKFAIGYRNGDVQVRSTETQELLTQLPRVVSQANHLAFDPSARWLLCASTMDGTARLVDLHGVVPTVQVQHGPLLTGVAISPKADSFATGCMDGTLAIWRSIDRHCTHRFSLGERVIKLAYTPDGQTLLAMGYGKGAKAWDVASGRELGAIGPEAESRSMAVSSNGSVAVYGLNGICIQRPDFNDRTATMTIRDAGTVECAAFNRTETMLLAGNKDNTARMWSVSMGRQIGPELPHQSFVLHAAWGPDGTTVVTVAENELRRWRVFEALPATGVTDWVRSRTGRELNDRGEVVELSREDWLKFKR